MKRAFLLAVALSGCASGIFEKSKESNYVPTLYTEPVVGSVKIESGFLIVEQCLHDGARVRNCETKKFKIQE